MGSGQFLQREQEHLTISVTRGLEVAARRGALVAAFFAIVGCRHATAAQERDVTIQGAVYSAANTRPLAAALVSIDYGSVATRSNINGLFTLESLRPGTYTLSFERAGYEPRAFRVVIPDTLIGFFDLGPVELRSIDAPTTTLRGMVTRSENGERIATVPIALNGEVVAVTGADGTFQIDSVERGNNLIEARRIGYVPLTADLDVQENSGTLEIALTLEPLPFRLDDVEVVVDGEKTIYAFGRMRDFYRRRKSTPGEFITREEIERRNPMEISDMLYGVPGVRVSQSGFARQITIRGCTPVIYLDGMPLRGVELDAVVFPEHVEAIEVHRGAFMPVEFMTFGSCAAIVIWTR